MSALGYSGYDYYSAVGAYFIFRSADLSELENFTCSITTGRPAERNGHLTELIELCFANLRDGPCSIACNDPEIDRQMIAYLERRRISEGR